MSPDPTAPTQAWDVDDLGDCGPLDFLVGHMEGRWYGDEDSLNRATVMVFAGTLTTAGLDAELAVDKAIEAVERGVTITFDQTGNIRFDIAEVLG